MLASAIALAAFSAAAQAESAPKRPIPKIEIAEPAGFASLTGPQVAVVDVWFGGKRIGDTEITFRPGALALANPGKLVALLSDLADPAAVAAALSVAELAAHEQLACTPGADPRTCGQLSPEVAGVIFDRERFRLDLFINPRLLAVKSQVSRQYLPEPEHGLAVVNAISAVLSGSSGSSPTYNFQNRVIIGDADRRLRADLAYATGFGVQADRLVAEIDRPGWRYSAGAFWAPGTDLIGRRKMIGIGIETQIDTRLDKDEMRGTPLVVFLGQRARVEIVRDGRLLSSRIYDAGNQRLDTSGLPNGSYEVVLRIEEAGGSRHEERRFFSKNFSIPALGQRVMFAYAGVLADDFARSFLSPTRIPFMQAGLAHRFNLHFAADATVLATNKAVIGELGAYYIDRQVQIRLAGIAGSQGTRGVALQIASQGNTRFNFNFDLRHIRPGRRAALDPFGPDPELGPDASRRERLAYLPLARRTFTQIAGNLSYSTRDAQIGFAASYRREQGQKAAYSYGPALRWDVLRRGPLHLAFNGNLAITDQGRAGYAGLSLQLLGGKSSAIATAGWRTNNLQGDGQRSGPVAAIQGSLQSDDFAGAQLNAGVNYEHDLEKDLVGATASLRADRFTLGGDVSHDLGRNGGQTQYGLDFQTSMAVRGGTIAFDGRNQGDGMAMIRIDSAHPSDRFEVLVNDMAAGTLGAGDHLAVALPAYRQYDFRIRQTAGELLRFDGSARRIGLYPGNVARLTWSADPVAAMFGRLLLDSGEPVRMGAITVPGGIGETDDNGYFQIDAAIGSQIEVALRDGKSCRVMLPVVRPQNGYAPLGTLVCRLALAPVMISSAAP